MLAATASLVLGACSARTDTNSGGDSGSGAAAPSKPADAADPKGDGKATCSGVSLAYAGTINGGNAALGQNILWGVKLAVQQHNEANKGCQVDLKQFDTEGSPDKAPGIVTQVISDPKIIGAVGLPFSGESKAAGPIFEQAGLVHVTPSATNPDLATHGWKTFFRALGNDAVQGPAAAKFITENLKAAKVCVIKDDSEYGKGLAKAVSDALGSKLTCSDDVKTKQTDFAAVVGKVKSANPDAIFYSGYYQEAAPFATQLNDAGVKAKFVGPDGVKDDEFVKGAGDASAAAYFTCPCVPADAFTDFFNSYKKLAGQEPGTYSPEGYDATTILLKGIDKGIKDRAGLLDFVKNYDGQGLTKHFKWDDKGELAKTTVWTYKVDNGKIVKNVEIK
ncbi:branched-chain amino acid ABC transporter substrate-binding protein [Solihabitans fulvus]|uniref:Branched-chain amino acid ABC transporter substrate-binding protein n=1 Tax=Solihabitans fulvus TaxID=1892852 RepID=A0A5B2XEV8_9PSEU|nr:branched-chain amino acid ABC transporter substrate-binding protein [Solihabitans fulvus]KAA2261609.1 branched-chain amino acid ABC transporter substrate-binding protein [Solihabitans fulvus]